MNQSNSGRGGSSWRRPGGWRGRGRGGRGNGNWNNRGRGWGQQQGNRGSWRGGYSGNSSQPTQPRLVQSTLIDLNTPYKSWRYYFPELAYSDNSPAVKRVKVFEKYFIHWLNRYNVTDLETKGYFTVDYKEISADPKVLTEFSQDMRQSPEIVLQCLGLAMHQVMSKELELEYHDEMPLADMDSQSSSAVTNVQIPTLPKLHCRLINFEPVTSLKNLKANYYGKFVTVKGTVVRVSNIKPMCTKMTFECNSCSASQVVLLPDGKYVVPTKCASGECRGRNFQPKRSHEETETIDWQTIRLQEIMDDDQRESGRIPRTVDCEFSEDLVDSCVPGDMVSVSGIVKVINSDEGRGRHKDKCMFLLYLQANSVTNTKGSSKASGDNNQSTGGMDIEFTMKELYAIEEIQSQPSLYRLIIGSVCPGIYGHEMVKAGLVLGLFGGSQKYANDSNRIPVRGDPHILVVGDPGLGKSQMLQAVANVAPRSVYVCGNTTTTSGLTVTLCRESGGHGDYALEAGALVLADQGCCCIDEFDKMGNQHQALLEAMEQQSISIAKAGIVCSLPARTSILAAANPAGGHYNKSKTVSENLRMGSALLSRFDLVFILLDKPDEEMDSMLSEHVMALHAGKKRRLDSSFVNATPRSEAETEELAQWEADKPLSERLKMPRGEQLDPIPPQLLRKYVGYARKYVHPKIGPEAAQIIQNFYLNLRKKHQTQDSTPITTRQLESLIRLTESRARLELRELATADDAKDVIEIMKYSMIDTYSDDHGILDFNRSQHGSGMSKKGQAKKLVALLQQISEKTYNSLFTVQEMRQIAQEARLNIADFEQFVSSMNNQGYLLKKGPRVYQLQTAGY